MRWTLLMLCSCGRLGFDIGQSGSNSADAPHLLVDAPMFSLDAGQCPPSYAPLGTSCFRASTANGAWLPAELACEADAVGAHLAVIDDAAEETTLETAFTVGIRTWIGISKRQTAAYRTVIDTAGFRDLGPNQTEPSEDCVSIDGDGHWYTHSCTDSNRYICEYDGIAAVPSAY